MDSDHKFWLFMWTIIFCGICGLSAIGTHYYSGRDTKIVQAIKDGADPLSVVCAVDDSMGDNPTCIIIAAKAK